MRTLTPLKAIRAKCVDCCCGDRAEVRKCNIEKCPLWPYKMGHRPVKDTDIDKDQVMSKKGGKNGGVLTK